VVAYETSGDVVAQNNNLIAQVRPFLRPDERFQSAFPAQAGPNPFLANSFGFNSFGVLGVLIGAMFRAKRRIIAVTDQAVLVLAADARYAPTTELVRLPRSTRIGPLRGTWAKTRLDDMKLYVHRRYHPVVQRADGSMSA
jgi:hypothetical protein